MPEIGGHEFAPYAFQQWPMSVTRSDNTTIIADNESEVAEFLKDDPEALKAHNAMTKASGDARAIQVKADADMAKIKHDAEMAQAKVMEDAAKASAAPVEPAEAPKPAPSLDRAGPPRPAMPAAPETLPVPPVAPRPPVSTAMPQMDQGPSMPPMGRPAPLNPNAAAASMQQASLNAEAAAQKENQDGVSGPPKP